MKEDEENEPKYEFEGCSDCEMEAEQLGFEYEYNATWDGDCWICDSCRRPC